jgi:outer membrane protein TolC
MKKSIFWIYTILSLSFTANAQVSMMNEVSFSYLDKLIAIGKANYPKFKWTTARVSAAKASYDKTKFGVLDFISLSYIYYPGNTFSVNNVGGGTSTFLNGYQAGVFINVGTMLSKPATVKQAKEEYIAAKMDKESLDLDIELEIRKRYFTYVEMSNILRLKTQSLGDADDIQKAIKYKFQKGEVTFDIYNQALLSFATFSQEKISAEANLLIAKSALEEIVGTTLEKIK